MNEKKKKKPCLLLLIDNFCKEAAAKMKEKGKLRLLCKKSCQIRNQEFFFFLNILLTL